MCTYSQGFLDSRDEMWFPVLLVGTGNSIKIPFCVFLVKFLIYSTLTAFACHLEIDTRSLNYQLVFINSES